MHGKATRTVRIDIDIDRLIADTARLQQRTKKAVIASAIGAYVEANRAELAKSADRTSYRIETATDPHLIDPATGLTAAQREDLFRWFG